MEATRDVAIGWKITVKNTFLDDVYEDKPLLTHVSSAPAKLLSNAVPGPEEYCRIKPTVEIASIVDTQLQQAEDKDPVALTNDRSKAEESAIVTDVVIEEECQRQADDSTTQEVKKLSKTARRNQRTREKARQGKTSCVESASIVGDPFASAKQWKQCKELPSSSSTAASSTVNSPAKGASKDSRKSSSPGSWKGTDPSARERLKLRNHFLDVFREEYKVGKELSTYASSKLMTQQELSTFNCSNSRRLVSVYGEIFDVTSNTDEYGPSGSRSFEAGTDITWAVVCGVHVEEKCNCFYDMFKAKDDQMLAGRLMSLCSTIIAFQRDYGKPVGRLSEFSDERRLPAPPTASMEDVCPVQ
jgi:hypothetical protein